MKLTKRTSLRRRIFRQLTGIRLSGGNIEVIGAVVALLVMLAVVLLLDKNGVGVRASDTDEKPTERVSVTLLLGPDAAAKLPFSLDPSKNCLAGGADYDTCTMPPVVTDYAAVAAKALTKSQMEFIDKHVDTGNVFWNFSARSAEDLEREYAGPSVIYNQKTDAIVAANW